jgi:hypothetical protein
MTKKAILAGECNYARSLVDKSTIKPKKDQQLNQVICVSKFHRLNRYEYLLIPVQSTKEKIVNTESL